MLMNFKVCILWKEIIQFYMRLSYTKRFIKNIIINVDFQNALNLPTHNNVGTTVYIVVFKKLLQNYIK